MPPAPFFLLFKTICFWWPINAAGAFFCKNKKGEGTTNNNNNNNNNNNAVLVARGGGGTAIPAILPRALRDGRKGDPRHKCCGKNTLLAQWGLR